MRPIKILITGARGFIGKHLLPSLLKNNQVVALMKAESNLDYKDSNLTEFLYDYNIIKLIELFKEEKFDLIIHLATFSPIKHNYNDIDEIIDSNLRLGTHILEAASQTGTKNFINASSHWQYFQSNKYKPTNFYAASKEAFEKLAEYFVEAEEFIVVNLLIYETFGEEDNRKKILTLIQNAIQNREKLDITSGNQILDLLHIEDIVEAFLITINHFHQKKMSGINHFGVFSGEPIKLIDLINVLGLKNYVNAGALPHREREVMFPSYPFEKLPGWSPKVTLLQRLKVFFNI